MSRELHVELVNAYFGNIYNIGLINIFIMSKPRT